MLRSAVLHFYDTLSLRAPSLCTVAALTWIRALWGVEIKSEPSLGAAKGHKKKKEKKGSQNLTLNTGVCMLGSVWSPDSGICAWMGGGVYAYMPAKVHLGVYTFACVVFAKGEGFSAFNYSSAKTLHVHSRASQPTDPDTLLRGSSWRKQTREEAWYTHFMGSSTNQLFKY